MTLIQILKEKCGANQRVSGPAATNQQPEQTIYHADTEIPTKSTGLLKRPEVCSPDDSGGDHTSDLCWIRPRCHLNSLKKAPRRVRLDGVRFGFGRNTEQGKARLRCCYSSSTASADESADVSSADESADVSSADVSSADESADVSSADVSSADDPQPMYPQPMYPPPT